MSDQRAQHLHPLHALVEVDQDHDQRDPRLRPMRRLGNGDLSTEALVCRAVRYAAELADPPQGGGRGGLYALRGRASVEALVD